jgi:phage terminase small subunit
MQIYMPTRRKTLAELENNGTLGRNLGRYQNRITKQGIISRPVGHAPTHLSAIERGIWAEVRRSASPGLLDRSDRLSLELLCKLVARMRSPDVKASELNALAAALARMGLTPVDRLKLAFEPPADPAEQAEMKRLAELD